MKTTSEQARRNHAAFDGRKVDRGLRTSFARANASRRQPEAGVHFSTTTLRAWLVLLLALACIVPGLDAATITGTVQARPATAPGDTGEDGGGYGSRRYKFIERVDYDALTDFIVYIDQPVPDSALPDPRPRAVITQRGGAFVPHVLPVLVGTTVEWPNEDTIFHNVFSMSETTPFDLGLYKSGDVPKRITFDRAGRVDVFCSIHTKMNCIVIVLPNPWFARADARGRYVIKDVPPGTYQLKAWHERLPAKVVAITVPAQGEVTMDFVLGFTTPAQP